MRKRKKKGMAGLLIMVMLASVVFMPQAGGVKAAGGQTELDVSAAANSELAITAEGEYLFTGTSASGKNIVIGSGAEGEKYGVVFKDLDVMNNTISPVCIKAGATVYLTIEGVNNFSTNNSNSLAIINVEEGANLIIRGSGTLTAKTTGSNGRPAAIGGNASQKCGSITIDSGILDVQGGVGIGSGYSASGGGGIVIINGGFITAVSNGQSPGIGTGNSVAAANLTPVIINGGTISATSGNGGTYGIGGNSTSGTDDIKINGGNLTAASGNLIRSAYKTSQGFMKVTIPGLTGSDVDSVYVNGADNHIENLHGDGGLFLYLQKNNEYTIDVVQNGTTYQYSANVLEADMTATLEETLDGTFEFMGTSIRTTNPAGIRFGYKISDDLRALDANNDGYEIEEYGVLVQKKEALTKVDVITGDRNYTTSGYIDFTLNPDDLSFTNGVRGIAYKKGADPVDIIYNQADGKTEYVSVLIGTESSGIKEENYATEYAVKPYIVLKYQDASRKIIYGAVKSSSMYDVAQKALADPDIDAKYNETEKTFLNGIVDKVEGNV